MRHSAALATLVMFLIAHGVYGQDTDEVKQLKAKVASLEERLESAEKKLNAAEKKNEQLTDENEQLRAAKLDGDRNKKNLAEQLKEGMVLKGKWQALNGNKRGGECTLTIREIKGNKFKATSMIPEDPKINTPKYENEYECVLNGNRFSGRVVGSPTKATISGVRKGDYLEYDFVGEDGLRSRSSFKLPE